MAVALPFIGAAVGWGIGGTFLGVSAVSWGWFAGSLLASAVGGQHHRGPRLNDLNVVGTDYGGCIPWAKGSPRLAPQYAWASPMREIANTQKVGKGGGNKQTTYTYECDVGVVLTENVTEDVARDWVNSELIRNGLILKEGVYEGVTVYTGEADQLPDPTYEAIYGAGNVSAFRGCTTIVIRGLQLGQGKQLPNLEHQVSAGTIVYADTPFQVPLAVDLEDVKPVPVPASQISPDGISYVFGDETLTISRLNQGESGGVQWTAPSLGSKIDNTTYPGQKLTFAIDIHAMHVVGSGTNSVSSLRFRIRSLTTNNEFYYLWTVTSGAPSLLTYTYGQTIGTPASPTGHVGTFKIELDQVDNNINFYFNNELLRTEGGAPANIDRVNFDFVGSGTGAFIDSVTVSNVRMWLGGYNEEAIVNTSEVPMNLLIEGLLDRAGYNANQYIVDDGLQGVEVSGYATSSVTSTRAHLETLRPFGLYEASCSDKLYIRPRASAPAGTVDWKDLGAVESAGDAADPFPLRFGSETEIPAQIAVRYRNVSANWNVGTEFSDRLNSSQVSTQVVEMAFGMTPSQAKSLADKMLKDVMAGLGRATLRVGGRKYAKYEPGDVLETTSPQGRTYRFRILVKKDTIVMQEWDVVLDDASVLDTPGITYEGYVSTENPVRVAPTEWEVMALRPLRDADASEPGPYVAVTPAKTSGSDEWPGAVFVRARLPEAFEQVFVSGDVCTMGTCLTTLGEYSGGSGVVQRGNKIRVRVRGELSSADYYDFFTVRTINAAVVGNEPIRFLRAEFVETDGTFNYYDLSGFLRGQLGMEDEIPLHVPGERFVLLDNSIRRMVNETTDIEQAQQVKAVTLNLLLDSVTDEEFTDDGIALRPLSPVYLRASQDSVDINLHWIRRSRLVSRWTDSGVIAPLGELVESYRVKVFDDPDAAPVRTVVVTSPEWTYSAVNIASDGFTTGDPITFTVHQLSDMVGEGDAATMETEAP